MAKGLGRHHMGIGADGLGDDRIDRKGVLAEHRIQAGGQIGTGHQLENIVGAITQRHLADLHATALRQGAFQSEAITIGIARQLTQSLTNRVQRSRAGAQRVFVAGQFDDLQRVEIQLARQLINRFTRHIGRQLLHARQGLGKKIGHTHASNCRLRPSGLCTALRSAFAAGVALVAHFAAKAAPTEKRAS